MRAFPSKSFVCNWFNDVPLRSCSLGARGLFVDMMSLMVESDPPGFLRIGGRPASIERLARIAGETPEQTAIYLNELLFNGVCVRVDGAPDEIFSDRVDRAEKPRTRGVR